LNNLSDRYNIPKGFNHSDPLRIAFVAIGYPSDERPNQNIFTHRSIKILSNYLKPIVISLRAWLPGLPFVVKDEWEGIPIVTIACPQLPTGKKFHFNALLLTYFGLIFSKAYLDAVDLIHSTELYSAGFVASHWAKILKKNHTSQAIGSDINLFLPHLMDTSIKSDNWKINGIACNSKDIRNKVLSLFPNISNVNVIYRGIDKDLFSPDGTHSNIFSSLQPVRFLYLGGFHTWNFNHHLYNIKGGHTLRKAWKIIESQIGSCSLVIGGPGCDFTKLEQWRSSLSRPDSVRFIGKVSPDNVPSVIRTSDVVVIPSLSEGLPNLANEAQSCGRPVLGSDAGGIPESVLDNKTGIIVSRDNAQELALGLKWFYSHKEKINSMGLNARKHVVSNFSWGRFSENMLILFRSAIDMQES